MKPYRKLGEYLGYEDEEPTTEMGPDPELPGPSLSIEEMPDIVSSPSEGVADLRQASPRMSVAGEARSLPQKKGWSPNWLAAAAAFTQNPALMQMLRDRQEAPQRKLQAELAAEDRQLKLAREGREAKKFAAIEPYLADSEQSKIDSRKAGAERMRGNADMQRALLDPNSEASKSAVDSASRMLSAYAEAYGVDSALSKRLAEAAASLQGKSADAVKSMLPGFEKLGAAGISQKHQKAMEAQGWNRIAQDDEHHDERMDLEREKIANAHHEKIEARLAKDQDKLNSEVEGANWTREMLKYAAELKKGVNTGPIADWAQANLQKIGLSSKDYNSLGAVLASINNRIIKELSGSNVTGNEWMRMQQKLAMLNDDDENFDVKLSQLMKEVESIKARAVNRYQRTEDGVTVDRSNTARTATARAPALTEGEKSPLKAPSGAPVGKRLRNPNDGGIYEVQADGTMKRVQ